MQKGTVSILDDPAYTYVDISQNNFHSGETHYEFVRYLYEYSWAGPKKPLNNTKIYGGDMWSYDPVGIDEGIARFIRNLFGGAASMRFHRRTANPYEEQTNFYGLGLGDEAKIVLRSMSLLLEQVAPWELVPTYDYLLNVSRNKAYALADSGSTYVVYLTDGGEVQLDLRRNTGRYSIRWLDFMNSEWGEAFRTGAGSMIDLKAPGTGPWIVLIKQL